MITVVLPDDSTRELADGATGADLATMIGRRLAAQAVAVEVNGELVDLSRELPDGARVRIITEGSEVGLQVLRHSTAHVLAQAVLALWPGARYAIGPAVEDGFYYDFELPGGARFSEDDLTRIEVKMREIVSSAQPFVREERSIEEGLELFSDQPFKREIIETVAAQAGQMVDDELTSEIGGAAVTTYRNNGFVDLCRGPHVPATNRLGHFKLMRVAGAYWRGDEHRPQLQRIYGTAFQSEAALKDHLHALEEAERRDHRRLGEALDLFSFPEEIGQGLVIFHPKGGLVRRLLEDYSRAAHEAAGYEFVYTPHITRAELFEISGHLSSFADAMFPPMELEEGGRYYLKPMNCPFHILVFRSRQRSYRELPLRLFEFGSVYRYEKSGVVHGLARVRGMTQDDAHIFCRPEDLLIELDSVLRFVLDLLRDYGLDDFYLELSTKPAGKAFGTDEEWESATAALAEAAASANLEVRLDEGGGAFYGPKISVQARDAIGRWWQLSTVQLDFQLPQRFELHYIGSDNARHRPIMIHRALFGTVERFFALLLEHYAGAWPTWLAPIQVSVLPIRDDHQQRADEILTRLREAGFRVSLEAASEPLGARVRRAKLEKIPYVLVVGDEDIKAGTVGVNARGADRPERAVDLDAFVARLDEEVASRKRGPAVKTETPQGAQ